MRCSLRRRPAAHTHLHLQTGANRPGRSRGAGGMHGRAARITSPQASQPHPSTASHFVPWRQPHTPRRTAALQARRNERHCQPGLMCGASPRPRRTYSGLSSAPRKSFGPPIILLPHRLPRASFVPACPWRSEGVIVNSGGGGAAAAAPMNNSAACASRRRLAL